MKISDQILKKKSASDHTVIKMQNTKLEKMTLKVACGWGWSAPCSKAGQTASQQFNSHSRRKETREQHCAGEGSEPALRSGGGDSCLVAFLTNLK